MNKKLTQKLLLEGAKICKEFGYWSENIIIFLNKFAPDARIRMSSALGSVYNSRSFKASRYYDLFKKNRLI